VSGWRPLLSGELAVRAAEVARGIAAQLAAVPPASGGDGLAGGSAGLALLFRAVADEEAAVASWERALDGVADLPIGLFEGLAGIGWTAARLGPGALDPDWDREIEDALGDVAGDRPWTRQLDLVFGLAGLALFALDRLPQPGARALLERVVARLEESAIAMPGGGIGFRTRPEHMKPERARRFPDGFFDLGLAHGAAGIAAVLARAAAAGVPGARPLCDGAVAWLLEQEREWGFPDAVLPGVDPAPTRAAWCYGDPGVAAGLLAAARAVGSVEWERRALAAAHRAAARPMDECGVIDAGLCHGAVGLGHLFNRLYQATGSEALAAAAERWFARALEMEPLPDAGVLVGSAGLALALLAATGDRVPDWDGFLLLALAD